MGGRRNANAVIVLGAVAVVLSGCVLIPPTPAETAIRKVADNLEKAPIGTVVCQHEERDFTPLTTVPYQNSVAFEDVENAKEVVSYLVSEGFDVRPDLAGENYQTLVGPAGIRATVFTLTRKHDGKSVGIGGGEKCKIPTTGLVDVYLLPK